jgi:outer membrane protein OmpA-like peptidoglycan-associated protein
LPPPPTIAPASPQIPPPSFVEFDTKITREEGAKIQTLRFSPGLAALAGPVLQAKGGSADPSALQDPADPLGISFDFLQDLLSRQFQAARGTTDATKLTHEKLAGLCIVFEEGGYSLLPSQGLNVTSVNDQSAWTIVRVKGGPDQSTNEFGIEMARAADGNWKVNALNFDKMLQSYAQSTEAGKVYYSPVVASPGGGESLVVYFEYDKAELTPRASRQLEIVSGLLKTDAAKKLRISGHTDSTGTQDYNVLLSRKRAEIVKQTLQTLGVDRAQIIEQAVGEAMPLDPNERSDGSDNPEGRSRNRRTEIYLDF